MTAPRATLSTRDLACLRGGRLVFRGLDLDVAGGEALTLRGPNGSGKSSLLRLLAGLLRPSEGQILWNGQAVQVASPAAARPAACWA
jgi:heme exporter protein A